MMFPWTENKRRAVKEMENQGANPAGVARQSCLLASEALKEVVVKIANRKNSFTRNGLLGS